MRLETIGLLLATLTACAHTPPAAPPTAAESMEAAQLELPAAFDGRLSNGNRGTLVLLDPERYVFMQRSAVTLFFRHGTWEREGADAIELAGANPGRFRIVDPDRLEEEPQPTVRPGEPQPSLARASLPALVAGMAARRHGRIFFEPCAGGAAIPLVDATGVLEGVLGEGSTPVYTEILATALDDGAALLPPAGGEELVAWDPQRMQREGGCAAFVPGLVATATGNEPGWKLEIDTRSVRLHRMGEDPVGAPWAPFRWEEGAYRYRADTGDARWDVALRPLPCADTMADARFAWTAEVRVNRRALRGCAHLGTAWQALHER